MEPNQLLIVFKQTNMQLSGHGNRNVGVLKEAFDNISDFDESDIYGQGKWIDDFQAKMAKYLGKEAAVFFPSGTMAQQIALRIWCDEKEIKKVAYHPLSHLEIHEEDGLKELHQIKTILLAERDRVISLEDVMNMKEDVASLLLELPQREIGGQLPDYETLKSIAASCKEKGIKLHLDGARLFEILPYYNKTAVEISNLFDSVYVSLYKGIGGVAGAILAGDKEFIKKSKVWKRRHGGDLISLYPYIVSADYYFTRREGKMKEYYQQAKELAWLFNQCTQISTKPEEPVSNMFHVHIAAEKSKVEEILVDIMKETGIGITSNLKEIDERHCYFELSIGDQYGKIEKAKRESVVHLLNKKMNECT